MWGRQPPSSGETQAGLSETLAQALRFSGRIRVSAEEAGGSARGRAVGEDARGADYLSGAGPWVAGAGPGGPGAPGGSHNADIPEPEPKPEPEAGAAERSGACALARALKGTSGDEASQENPSGDSRGPRTLVPRRAAGPAGAPPRPPSLPPFSSSFFKGPWIHRRFGYFS